MRTIVDIPQEQIELLAAIGKREQLSRAELMRRAISEYINRHQPEQQETAFGLWRQRDEDGLAYQERLRQEWNE